jgi:mitochondrial fission protein ELM1
VATLPSACGPDLRSLWIISDGNPGHYNQSLAIAEALVRNHGAAIHWVKVRLAVRGFLRPTLTALTNCLRRPLPAALESLCYRFEAPLPAERPDIIVSSGGDTAFLNVLLARRLNCRNLFVGQPASLNYRNFDAVLDTEPPRNERNCIRLGYLPTRLTPESARRAGVEFRQEKGLGERPLCSMLIGGKSRTHEYGGADWRALAEAMNHLAAKYGFGWLVTSSRRTGAEGERLLQELLDPKLVADTTWWGADPRNVVPAYLGASQAAFCTQDSMTMLSESIASGQPVYALRPQHVLQDQMETNFNGRFLAENVEKRKIRTVAISDMGAIDIPADASRHFEPVDCDLMSESVQQLELMLRRAA